jgi:HAMP domain-containing protein
VATTTAGAAIGAAACTTATVLVMGHVGSLATTRQGMIATIVTAPGHRIGADAVTHLAAARGAQRQPC